LKKVIKQLTDKSRWITLDDGRETLIRWIEKPYIEPNSGTIQIRLDKDLKPYLLHLKEQFTQYSLYFILAMRSQYSIRVYELLKSYEYLKRCEFDIDDFKLQIGAEKYQRHADFKRFVLDTAVNEINKYADIDVSYELVKKSRRFAGIKFKIIKKKPGLMYKAYEDIEKAIKNP
jgi:plasmid replication initiation protein